MYDIVIIGAGPSGLTAGIYAGRAGLNTIILDMGQSGGNANSAPLIENFPGIDGIAGINLMKKMKEQTSKYTQIKEFIKVKEIVQSIGNTFTIKTNKENFDAKSVIIATGTTYKSLPTKGVKEFSGLGVSYCAVCDGNFFIDQEVLVIGGGNSAATEALYLNNIGVKCSLVHRRDELRCDLELQKEIKKQNINVYWNSELKEIKGNGRVEKVTLYNKITQEEITLNVSGVFIAIGQIPNNKIALDSSIECDDLGYIITDKNMETNVAGIYAVGDITGGVKQIVVASGQGALAATRIQNKIL